MVVGVRGNHMAGPTIPALVRPTLQAVNVTIHLLKTEAGDAVVQAPRQSIVMNVGMITENVTTAV